MGNLFSEKNRDWDLMFSRTLLIFFTSISLQCDYLQKKSSDICVMQQFESLVWMMESCPFIQKINQSLTCV